MAPTPHQIFPLVVPCDVDMTRYEGFVTLPEKSIDCSNLWFQLSDISQGPSPLKDAKFDCSPELRNALRGYEWLLLKRINSAPSVANFFLELRDMLQAHVKHRLPGCLGPPSYYSGLVEELKEVGWKHVAWIDKDLTAVRLCIQDDGGRYHEVLVSFPAGYPVAAPVLAADLPGALALEWKEGFSLKNVMDAISEAVTRYQDLWDCLDDIDEHAWILEPSGPPLTRLPRCCTHRTIGLSGHCSMSLVFNPDHPRVLTQVQFTGSDATVQRMQKLWKTNSCLWSELSLPRANVECLLEVNLPSPDSAAIEDLSADCGICYAYRLVDPSDPDPEGKPPNVTCENPQCGRLFHRSCLSEWLRALSDTRQAFNTLFGECPYCSQLISVNITA